MTLDEVCKSINTMAIEQARFGTRMDEMNSRIQEQREMIEVVHKLVNSVDRLTQKLETTTGEITKLRTDVDEIQKEPGKKWDRLVTIVITAVVSGFIGYMLTQFLAK